MEMKKEKDIYSMHDLCVYLSSKAWGIFQTNTHLLDWLLQLGGCKKGGLS